MDFNTYKDSLLDYLKETENLEKQDIEEHKNLPDDEKEEEGYLIREAVVIEDDGKGNVKLKPNVNHTKWRIGDTVRFVGDLPSPISGTATVTDNFEDCICLMGMPVNASLIGKFSLSIMEPQMTGLFISAINNIEEGKVGSFYLGELGQIQKPEFFDAEKEEEVELPENLNTEQKKAILDVLKEPSLYAIQGPPGTGKTDVLATIAEIFSKRGEEVLVISNSHQAVNNALNKISTKGVPTYKIGNELKSLSLNPSVKNFSLMREYNVSRKKTKKSKSKYYTSSGDVVGMTLCGAILNLVIHDGTFMPSIVLIDEASQIPLGYGAAIGALQGGTYVFIGDDRQMPPIFHEKMASNPLSVSIFDHLQSILSPEYKTVLTTSYRMNRVVCRFVSENFYEPHGVVLKSHDSIADRHIDDEELKDSIQILNIPTNNCEDENPDEAKTAVQIGMKYWSKGLDVAIITPYRKQVNLVREEWNKAGGNANDILIDTVERLQGQDVDVIILSMATSDVEYYKGVDLFLLDRNRLNVMFSRAKQKVVVIKSPLISFDFLKSGNGDMQDENNVDHQPVSATPMFEIENEPTEARDARKLILESFKDLEFYEEEHKYLLNGKELKSISSLGHRFESKPFDSEIQAEKYAVKHGRTAEYWLAEWDRNAFRATTLGTKTHEFGESLAYIKAGHPEFIRDSVKSQFNKKHYYFAPIHPKEEAVELFLNELPTSYHLVLNEARVYSGKNPDSTKNLKEQICGTFDMLYWYDGDGDSSKAGFVVFDYKTNASLTDDYNRANNIKLLPPFDNLYQENLGIYTIQLGLYSLLLKDIGINIIDRQLIWLKDDGTYEKIPLPDITETLRVTL